MTQQQQYPATSSVIPPGPPLHLTPCNSTATPCAPADAQVPANPSNPFLFAMGQNVYQTKNYIFGSYHYVACYSSEFVVPTSTAEVAQALAHYYKRSQVQTPHKQSTHCSSSHAAQPPSCLQKT